MSKGKVDITDFIDIFVWNDGYTNHFKTRIETALKDKYKTINYIYHNFDFSTILHRIYRGHGACVMPLKTALIYKSEGLGTKSIAAKYTSVYMYHNDNLLYKDGFDKTKQVLLTFF
ncbi:hypothetical protein [Citrobacter freundii]|nr:hypothetical protein RHA96_18150 [Citrobacter freundii]